MDGLCYKLHQGLCGQLFLICRLQTYFLTNTGPFSIYAAYFGRCTCYDIQFGFEDNRGLVCGPPTRYSRAWAMLKSGPVVFTGACHQRASGCGQGRAREHCNLFGDRRCNVTGYQWKTNGVKFD